jgi:triacylglycerol lipase
MVVLLLALLAPAAARAEAGPPLTVPPERLAAALECPQPVREKGPQPVLLVHGTATTPEASWSWNFARSLPPLRHSICTVRLPDRALEDIQVASEYVVHAVRELSEASDGDVDLIGHSQGTLEPRWAAKWWPDVAESLDDVVLLAPPSHGVSSAEGACTADRCAPAVWQMNRGARFLSALNRGDETPGPASYTVVYSQTDELVTPPETAPLAGASNNLIQSLCPGRPVHHVGLLFEAVSFALTLDALRHPGPANAARFDPATCLQSTAPGVDLVQGAVVADAYLYGDAAVALAGHRTTESEPPLAPYAAD